MELQNIILLIFVVSVLASVVAVLAWIKNKIVASLPEKSVQENQQDDQDIFKDDFIEIQESKTTVDLGVFSGFKFGVGFSLGIIAVSFFFTIFFGAMLTGLLRELTKSLL